jgi:hypothetical protein
VKTTLPSLDQIALDGAEQRHVVTHDDDVYTHTAYQ